jgi:hypothetical protein
VAICPSPKSHNQLVACGSLVSVNVTGLPTAAGPGVENAAVGGTGEYTGLSAAGPGLHPVARTCSWIGSLLPRGPTTTLVAVPEEVNGSPFNAHSYPLGAGPVAGGPQLKRR